MRLRRLALPSLTLIFGFAALPAAARVQPIPTAFVSGMGAKCLQAEGDRTDSGTRLVAVPCTGEDNEFFEVLPDRTIQYRRMCWDASSGHGRDGDAIILFKCNRQDNQRWSGANGQIRGINGKCIVLTRTWAEVQPAALGPCDGSTRATWMLAVRYATHPGQGRCPRTGQCHRIPPGEQHAMHYNDEIIAPSGRGVFLDLPARETPLRAP